jgi:ABC-type phosphate transport system substrate-binding protein
MNWMISVVRLIVAITLWSFSSVSMAVSVVANEASVLETALSFNELKQIFTLEKTQWKNKRSIVVFVLPANDLLHKEFCEELLEIYPHQLQRMWERHLFSEKNAMVYVAKDHRDLLKSVAMTPGAIGYLNVKSLDGKTAGIKKIEVIQNSYKNKEEIINELDIEETKEE